jgi:hypothetical protein
MLESLAIGIGGIISMMILWFVVQSLWRKTFSDHITDEDALADRSSCGNCNCTTFCEKKTGQYSEN